MAERTIASAMCFCTPWTGARVSRPRAAGAAGPTSSGTAADRWAARSSRVMMPPGPWPVTSARSTPCWRAMKRTGGAASGRAPGCGVGAAGGSGWSSRCPGGTLRAGAVVAAGPAPAATRRGIGGPVAHEHRHLLGRCGAVVCFGGCTAGGLDGDERRTHLDHLAGRGEELDDRAGEGARQFDDGLLGLDLDEDLVQLDGFAGSDVPRHHLCLGEPLPQVGQEERPDALGAPAPAHGWRLRSTSWRMRSASGRKWRSNFDAGYGVAKPPTRRTGASKE